MELSQEEAAQSLLVLSPAQPAALLPPPSTHRLKSEVWQFFKRLAPELAECLVCDESKKKHIKLAKKSTSGMIAHLKAFHKEEYVMACDQKNHNGRRARQCAAIMIENPSTPPNLFRSESFLALFPEVEWHNFPNESVMTKIVLPEMVTEIASKNRAELSGVPVTLIVDTWTSHPLSIRGGRREPVTLTLILAYFINHLWEMEGRLIAVKQSWEEPRPETIRAMLDQTILDEQLDVVAVVCGGTRNLRKAVEGLGFRHPHCTNHHLSLAVSRGLAGWEEGASLLHRLRDFAKSLNDPVNEAFRNEYFTICLTHTLRPITLPCPPSTRWGGDIRLIESALQQMPAINETLIVTDQQPFSSDDVASLISAATVLKPFGKLGLELSQEGRLLSESFFVLRKLQKHLETCSTTSSLAASILPHFTSLTPHFFSSSSTLSSVFFDPSAVFHFKSEANWRNVASTFFPNQPSLSSSSTFSSPSVHSSLSSRRAALYGDDNEPPMKMVKQESSSGNELLDAEVLLYLEQTLNGVDVTLEALDYWKTYHDKFPKLSIIARRYLSTPPTSIDAEKVLSAAGLLFRKTLSNLLSNGNIEEICMLRLVKQGSLRALSHSRDRVIISPSTTVESLLRPHATPVAEEVEEVPEPEEERDWSWDEENSSTNGDAPHSGPLFASSDKEVKQELPDSVMPSPV
ncbi:hypothetical protein PRIPAC_74623 [Pristionchus pacificus]|uniref:Uncharacterized protein n=1 Tax=Pristionchus pacificus TaxID=54126 RepID=A0A2A6BGA6_PRIPA|nr:hypothetical protein PRIPAC_74623 [Pristionchus pacificus]|eukprot:PDM64955.1 hypothetical protein PRIPAC_53211 [Pristionchus pacificus]